MNLYFTRSSIFCPLIFVDSHIVTPIIIFLCFSIREILFLCHIIICIWWNLSPLDSNVLDFGTSFLPSLCEPFNCWFNYWLLVFVIMQGLFFALLVILLWLVDICYFCSKSKYFTTWFSFYLISFVFCLGALFIFSICFIHLVLGLTSWPLILSMMLSYDCCWRWTPSLFVFAVWSYGTWLLCTPCLYQGMMCTTDT